MTTRASTKGRPIEIGSSNLSKSTSVSDSVKVWNQAPESVTGAKTLNQSKNAIKSFMKTLSI